DRGLSRSRPTAPFDPATPRVSPELTPEDLADGGSDEPDSSAGTDALATADAPVDAPAVDAPAGLDTGGPDVILPCTCPDDGDPCTEALCAPTCQHRPPND